LVQLINQLQTLAPVESVKPVSEYRPID
jgi:hypothetical protein